MREYHVRFCERLAVKFRWSTHLYSDEEGEFHSQVQHLISLLSPVKQ